LGCSQGSIENWLEPKIEAPSCKQSLPLFGDTVFQIKKKRLTANPASLKASSPLSPIWVAKSSLFSANHN